MNSYEEYLQDSLSRLKDNLKEMKTRPITFIGSGFSRRYIYTPNWKGLLHRLIEENPEIEKPLQYYIQEHDGDLANIATELIDYYHQYAWNNFDNKGVFPSSMYERNSKSAFLKYKIASLLETHLEDFTIDSHEFNAELKAFIRLNPQAIITTNYDTLLETLFPNYQPIFGQQIIKSGDTTKIGHILKIHGSIEEIESIVIDKKDYESFQEKQIYLLAKLFTYFMEHPIVFIGYGLGDENIRSILYNVKQMIDSEAEPIIQNMWFVDWSSSPIPENEVPHKQKIIPVGNGESVRLNYIIVNNYEELYEALYQDSLDIDLLQRIEQTVYNVVKSDSITNLEVDIASIANLTDREGFLKSITNPISSSGNGINVLPTFAHITDPNQLVLQFPLTATKLAQKVYDNETVKWHHGYQLIYEIKIKTGVSLRNNNNVYHVKVNGVSSFSLEMVDLLKKVKNMEPYTLNLENRAINYYPETEEGIVVSESAATIQ